MESTLNMTSHAWTTVNDPLRRASASRGPSASSARRLENRRTIGQFVGSVFYSTLLSQMQASTLKTSLFHGGRGEDAFAGQLALELGKRIGQSASNPLSGGLIDSITRRLERDGPSESAVTNLSHNREAVP